MSTLLPVELTVRLPRPARDPIKLIKGSLLKRETEAAMIACGVTSVQIGLETDSTRTALEVVANTDLITTMPRARTQPYLEDALLIDGGNDMHSR